MFNLLLGWAALVGVSVFVLYVRDPYAAGRRRPQFENTARKVGDALRSACSSLRTRGLCPSNR